MARNIYGRPVQARSAGQGGGIIPTESGMLSMTRAQLEYELASAPPEVQLAKAKAEQGIELDYYEKQVCREFFMHRAMFIVNKTR